MPAATCKLDALSKTIGISLKHFQSQLSRCDDIPADEALALYTQVQGSLMGIKEQRSVLNQLMESVKASTENGPKARRNRAGSKRQSGSDVSHDWTQSASSPICICSSCSIATAEKTMERLTRLTELIAQGEVLDKIEATITEKISMTNSDVSDVAISQLEMSSETSFGKQLEEDEKVFGWLEKPPTFSHEDLECLMSHTGDCIWRTHMPTLAAVSANIHAIRIGESLSPLNGTIVDSIVEAADWRERFSGKWRSVFGESLDDEPLTVYNGLCSCHAKTQTLEDSKRQLVSKVARMGGSMPFETIEYLLAQYCPGQKPW